MGKVFLFVRNILILLMVPFFLNAQSSIDADPNLKKAVSYPQFQFKGLFQARYLNAFTDNVDVAGLHHSSGDFTQNTFDLKRVRLSVATKISEQLEVAFLVNFADFKSDPKSKVLENAYAKYTFNEYVSVIIGQFRPNFGIEESEPADIIKSFDFSNQYYEFGKNGWASFQIGASLMGDFAIKSMPVHYAFSVVNGNGRNQEKDKDNGKQYSSRWVFGLSKKYKVNLGLNGGLGTVFKKDVYAFGADATFDIKLTEKFSFDGQFEYKIGTNHNLYFSLPEANRVGDLSNYEMRGFYFLPNIRYEINHKKLTSIEFSCRYESFDDSYKVNSNLRQTYTPMVSLEFGKAYRGRIEFGFEIDRFENNISNTTTFDDELFIVQFQCRL
nr:porin [uncultured Flavobacterium sp.]